jgi:hypothetical protein
MMTTNGLPIITTQLTRTPTTCGRRRCRRACIASSAARSTTNPECQGFGFGDDLRPTDPAYEDELDRKFYRPGELKPSAAWGNDFDGDIPF